ncbi:hypothetical protein SFUMM280S_00248 [Streptomyces fumanus]
MAITVSATGSPRSRVSRSSGAPRMLAGSRKSASMYAVLPSGVLDSSPWERVSTIGSLSTYTTRAPGATDCAISCRLGEVGMPVPMSRNWRIPASSASQRTARFIQSRLARMWTGRAGHSRAMASPASWSAG